MTDITTIFLTAEQADAMHLGRRFLPSYAPVNLTAEADALMADLRTQADEALAAASPVTA